MDVCDRRPADRGCSCCAFRSRQRRIGQDRTLAREEGGSMTDALRLDGIHKNFGALQVASDISLPLPVGARTALSGPNGAGKTTFVNMVTGALAPSSGTIKYFGQDITAASQAEGARAGLLRTFPLTPVFKSVTV